MTDYGLATDETWDFGEHEYWRFLIITKATPKRIFWEPPMGITNLRENFLLTLITVFGFRPSSV